MIKASEAIELYRDLEADESDLRERMREDLRFVQGNQWPDSIRRAREQDIENGPRPCLTMDKLSQYARQVVNDTRQNRPSIKIRAGENGDTDVAEILQGLCRNIEETSRADIAYDRAVEHAAHCGRGWIRIATQYSRDDRFEQDIRILSIADPLSVVLGTYTEPDGSDADCGFVVSDIPKKVFERMYPKNLPSSFSPVENWVSDEVVRIAEYYKTVQEPKKLLQLTTGHSLFESEVDSFKEQFPDFAFEVNNTRSVDIPKVMWYKLTAFDVLEETEWLSRWIPLIPVHGTEIWVDGKRDLFGLVRPGADAQRLYNYNRSTYAELIALAPRAPFILADGQVEDYEDEWGKANRVNLAYLRYKPIDVAGHAVPPPQRQPFAGVPAGLMQDMVQSEHDIQSSIGMYSASVGQPSNERSGKAILARQREGDIGSYHYRDNLGRSIRHGGRIIIDLIPKVYDTRRVLRAVGEDGVDKQVTLDPNTQQPVTEIRTAKDGVKKIYNPGLGTYDVAVTTGPGYTTKREEAANAILQLTQNAPQLFGVVGDLLVKSMDWPYADEIARRLRLMLPPALQQEDGQQQPVPPQAQQKIMQLGQALQAVTEQAKQIQAEHAKLKGIVDGKVIDKEMKAEDARVKMKELEIRELEVLAQKEEIRARQGEMLAQSLDKMTEQEERDRETVGAMSDYSKLTEVMQNGFAQMVEGLGQLQQTMMTLGKGVVELGAKLDEHESGRREREEEGRQVVLRSLGEGETRSLQAIEKLIRGAQTAAIVPELDDEGNVIGGTAIQVNGERRQVNLKG